MKSRILCVILIALVALGVAEAARAAKGEKPDHVGVIEKERGEFRKLLIKNPNYFGQIPDFKLKAVKEMNLKTKYEELGCLGFCPERDMLQAIVHIKRTYGYNGDLCSAGSREYVRFFADWNGDGDFVDDGEDVGVSSVNVHDIPGPKAVRDVPISFAVTIKVDPSKRYCSQPYLVKVKAILSWEQPPPEGDPAYPPVWGNTAERWIQIEPGLLLVKDILKHVDLKALNLAPGMLDSDVPISKMKVLTPPELAEIYEGKEISEKRFNFCEIQAKVKLLETAPLSPAMPAAEYQFADIMELADELKLYQLNTSYEQLGCVGLNYDLSNLVATLDVKLPYGYSGDLCHAGSHEYVAFWVYAPHESFPIWYWKYLGTASVNVHDIEGIPSEGLAYAVSLPVDLSYLQDHCSNPRVLKVRAVLSWQTPPPPGNPDYSPVWGNKMEAEIQIKPGGPIDPDSHEPFISVVGGMAVEGISATGYANGPSVYGGYSAVDSPFGGLITICGHISNPPNLPAGDNTLVYKVEYLAPGGTWQAITNKFKIWISKWDGSAWTMSSEYQVADADGFFTYKEDFKDPVHTYVEGNVLAQWYTPVVDGDGKYKIKVTARKRGPSAGPAPPAKGSNIVDVRVDNTKPEAGVALDAGPCTKFTPGDIISGKFTATDVHIWKYSLSVAPSVANPPAISPSWAKYPALSPPGLTDEPFTLTTTSATTPCGYVVYLHVWDRTIRNNHLLGNRSGANVGMCLLED